MFESETNNMKHDLTIEAQKISGDIFSLFSTFPNIFHDVVYFFEKFFQNILHKLIIHKHIKILIIIYQHDALQHILLNKFIINL